VDERTIQTPDWAVFIGDWSVERLVALEHASSRLRPFATLTLGVDNESGHVAGVFAEGDDVVVGAGDREVGLSTLFRGEVEEIEPGRVTTVRARDGMLVLERATVTQSWLRVTPQEVARAVLEPLGIGYQLGAGARPRRHHVVSRGLSVLRLLQQMDRDWGLGWDLYCEADGSVWWGPWDESPRYQRALAADPPILVQGESLFDLEPTAVDVGRAVTWLQPGLQHSTFVGLVDERFWQERKLARIERAVHRIGSSGGGRSQTEIEWRLVT